MTNIKTLWFTGLSGAGKSTLAQATAQQLQKSGSACVILDGDQLRQGLCADLGFSAADRHENIRRIAEVAALMNQAGLTVLVAAISPLQADRAIAHAIIGSAWREIHVATRLQVCEQRDTKGLYRRARSGELADFTGISAPYEIPAQAFLRIDTETLELSRAVQLILAATSATSPLTAAAVQNLS